MESTETLDMLLTAQVFEFAKDLRIKAAKAAARGSSALEAKFKEDHPVSEYMPAALAELKQLRASMLGLPSHIP